MGITIARRLGSGRHLILADYSNKVVGLASNTLQAEGFQVEEHTVDVSDYDSVTKLAQHAATIGNLEIVVHTAGVSATQASVNQIYNVNLLGVANVIEAFEEVASQGMSLTCIASIAGHFGSYSAELSKHLALAPLPGLLTYAELEVGHLSDHAAVMAYGIAKRGNILRVQAAATRYGQKGARINSISPGFILTPFGQAEITGPYGEHIQALMGKSPSKRAGTSEDVARAVAFLASPESSFIIGSDIIVDGGQTAARFWSSAEVEVKKPDDSK